MTRHAGPRSVAPPPAPPAGIEPILPMVEDALADLDFPISKRELMDEVRGRTVVFRGQNRDLAELVRDIADDAFDTEDELHDAFATTYGAGPYDAEEPERTRHRATGKDVVEDALGDLD